LRHQQSTPSGESAMNQVSEVLTTVFGLALVAAMAFEVKRRRKHLRELYNVLDEEDRQVVTELDEMVASGRLQPIQVR
jgi:flagellar biosynthesis/type III secretory pathway M-ring protein FliF/YscJ